jgi:alkyl sulfatase BDS1-like metallo-beta-lactamase superfamily hydrolase
VATDPLTLSTRILDSGVIDEAINRVDGTLWELRDGLAIVEGFSHCVVLRTEDGLMCFDTSGVNGGAAAIDGIRRWSKEPVSHIVYTHGHADHVGGSGAFRGDAQRAGRATPKVFAHRGVLARLDRYAATSDFNLLINQRQFGGIRPGTGLHIGADASAPTFLPADTMRPDMTFDDVLDLTIGDLTIEMHHDRGETDDHLWAWLPERKWLMCGDFFTWFFPNAGNPQKVQRYPLEWARALRRMAAVQPELLVPAHGLPIEGRERIAVALDNVARALEDLVAAVLSMMNEGASLDDIVHTVRVSDDMLALPYLRPFYDEPEFVVRNIWRLYGGWWDGAASRLKPAPDAVLGREVSALAGGPDVLIARAKGIAEDGDLRLACHLADFAACAAPDNAAIHERRAQIYKMRRDAESSLMAKGIFLAAARDSERVVNEGD